MDTRKSPSAITLKYDFQWLAPSLIGIGRAIPVGLGKCFIQRIDLPTPYKRRVLYFPTP